MSQEKADKYFTNGGENCPQCGSEDIQGSMVWVVKGGALQDCFCSECEAEWQAKYTLTSVKVDEVDFQNQPPSTKEK